MRRFGRILLNAATVLSLVLCVGVTALWVRSYHCSDSLAVAKAREYGLLSERGGLTFQVSDYYAGPLLQEAWRPRRADTKWERAWGAKHFRLDEEPRRDHWVSYTTYDVLRFASYGGGQRLQSRAFLRYRDFSAPHWLVAMTAALPFLGVMVGRRRGRTRQGGGLCSGCGYDLTGNVSGVCPECGAAVKA